MTPKERVTAQLQHKETDFVPYAALYFEDEVSRKLDSYYGNSLWQQKVNNSIREIPGAECGPELGQTRSGDAFGSIWRTDLRPFHLEKPVLARPSLAGYSFPNKQKFFNDKWNKAAVQKISEFKNYFTVVGFGFGLFERSWAMRGFENVLMDAIAEPVFYQELIERIAQSQAEIIEEQLTLPVDGIMFSDDWGDQRSVLLGPDRWRKYIKPHYKRLYQKVHQAGRYTISHCCGNVEDIIPDLIEIGLDVLQSVQPEAMDPYRLKKEYGRDITFWGGLGSQHLIPFGSPDEIWAEVRKLSRVMAFRGGYILGPAKSLQPETPVENAIAVIEGFLEVVGENINHK